MSDSKSQSLPRLAVVTCAVMEIEVEHFLNGQANVVHLEKLEQGLHNDPPLLSKRLQEVVARLEKETDAEAIVLVYGLCSRGIENVTAMRCRIIVPRAHDCITLLLGSRQRYAEYVKQNPGTYWYSPGWNRHHTPPGPQRYEKLRRQYVEKFGEDNADFLMESEQAWFNTYDRATYVSLTVGATEQDKQYTRNCADWLKWNYDEQEGDPQLLIDLLAGRWDDDRFLILQPGQSAQLSGDDNVLRAIEAGK
ncbi:MAG: DUF1638 domain-containing protein [Phycisphaeraceae bacterium]|nr:DUF1638 domain-containing protein [Phycisphaeraceae bacterium]